LASWNFSGNIHISEKLRDRSKAIAARRTQKRIFRRPAKSISNPAGKEKP
jgi:hypothetical protein